MFKKISLLVSAFFLVGVSTVSAHVKWFVDSEKIISESHNTTPFYYLTSTEVILWSIIAICAVLVFSIIDHFVKEPKHIVAFAEKHSKAIDRVAQVILGLFLITVSFIWQLILVPEFKIADTLSMTLQIVQIVIGIFYIFNITPRIASWALLGVYGILFFKAGPMAFFENLIIPSLALYFLIRNSPKGSWFGKLDKHAVEFVRIATGVSLIIFAFTEKLSYPELSLAFLDVHQWNFMANMGLTWFTNNLFVLSTGFTEMIFGVIFILGYLTRINTILIAGFFATSVVTMMVHFGAWEVEDLVVYSAAILFLFYGHGKTKFFHLMWPKSFLHRKTLR